MKIIFRFTFCVLLLAIGFSVNAQQSPKVPRIGFVSSAGDLRNQGPSVQAFRQRLRDLGHIEGKNISVEYRYAEGRQERLPALVAELVNLKVDVLVLTALTAVRAAKQANTRTPIVMVILSDPVATGLVKSLAQPGGSITGISRLTRELSGKRLELLQETVPGISHAAVVWDADAPGAGKAFQDYKSAARALKIQLQSLEMKDSKADLAVGLRAAKRPFDALIIINNALVRRHSKQIADIATKHRLASMCEGSDYVEAGGLMSYSANDAENYRRAAVYVDKILKGAKPADLPIEQPTKFELIINLKTAKQIGLTIPPNVLARADKVIR